MMFLRNVFSVLLLSLVIILFSGFGNPYPNLDVWIRNNRDEKVFVYFEVFGYLKEINFLGTEVYGLNYFNVRGAIDMAPYPPDLSPYPYPREIDPQQVMICYGYRSYPEVEGWHDKPVEEQFKMIYKELVFYDMHGNEILNLDSLTSKNFEKEYIGKYEGRKFYDWYLIIE
jgi:hypothetical protein